MDNPKNFQLTSDFSSGGNDTQATITGAIPSHTILSGDESTYSFFATVPSGEYGRQMRVQIQPSGVSGAINVPSSYVMIMVPITNISGGYAYAFADVSRISRTSVRLRVRVANTGPVSIIVPSFSVIARVRTVVAN